MRSGEENRSISTAPLSWDGNSHQAKRQGSMDDSTSGRWRNGGFHLYENGQAGCSFICQGYFVSAYVLSL